MTDRPTPTPTPLHLYVLIDESGSMSAIRDDAIGGFNQLLAEQRDDAIPGSRITLVFFDSQNPCRIHWNGTPLHDAIDLTPADFRPRGGTPLLDATGRIIALADAEAGARAAAGAVAEGVLVVTITDGHENASSEFDRDALTSLIRQREADGWEFQFLAADLAAFDDARAMGYARDRLVHFERSAVGMHSAMAMTNQMTNRRKAALRQQHEDRVNQEFEQRLDADRRRTEGRSDETA